MKIRSYNVMKNYTYIHAYDSNTGDSMCIFPYENYVQIFTTNKDRIQRMKTYPRTDEIKITDENIIKYFHEVMESGELVPE